MNVLILNEPFRVREARCAGRTGRDGELRTKI
jgi:hypothetical protein